MRGGPLPILCPHPPGLRIGLYGGSFNPPHAGHRHVTLLAMRRLRLDRVWWIVTPGNPLKDRRGLPPTAERIAAARALARHPRIEVTGVEEDLGVNYTIETLSYLVRRCPGVRFVWIMGADNLAGFHRWRGWREIASLMPIAVVDRPGWTLRAARSRAALSLVSSRRDETDAPILANLDPPVWIFLHGPRSHLSSTALRRRKSNLSERRDVEIQGRSTLSSESRRLCSRR